jgi:hypothetical protein
MAGNLMSFEEMSQRSWGAEVGTFEDSMKGT